MVDDRQVSLGVRKQRFVIAVLALEIERFVPVSRLVDLIWPERPPASARRMIHTYVSGLRAILDTHEAARDGMTLRGEPGGYQLHGDPMHIDSHCFRDLVARARLTKDDEARVALLDEALGLWHGPALTGLCDEDLRIRLCRHLEDARLTAYEDWGEAVLRLGRHHDLIDELSVLSGQHPHRQYITALLMRALCRIGLTTQALQTYERTRTSLADDLGVDPGEDLRQLHSAILRGGPELPFTSRAAGSHPVPAQLPAAPRHFVGRTTEIGELSRLLDRSAGIAVVVSTIDGAPGIGKTTLALHWAHRIAPRFPDGQLYVNLRGFDPSGPAMPPAEAVRGFLDAFDLPPQRIPATLPAQVALYRSTLANRRVLVLLDNARDAEQVRPLLPGTPGCLAVVTSRTRLTGLVTADGAHPVTLDLLSTVDSRELLARRIGAHRVTAESEATDEIITRCAQLPLALAVVAARAAARPDFPLATLADELRATRGSLDAFHHDDPATDPRTVFAWSYQRLSPAAGRLFRLLSVHLGPDLAVPAAASLAGRTTPQVLPLLAELARAHLIAEHSPGRYICHDLLRAYATELAHTHDTDTQRRDALRRILDHYLHTAYSASQLIPNTCTDEIPLAAPVPGATPEHLADHGEALAWFDAERQILLGLVERAADLGFGAHVWQLASTLTTYLNRSGHWRGYRVAMHAALTAFRDDNEPAEREVVISRRLGQAYVKLRRFDEARTQLEQTLELSRQIVAQVEQARVHLNLTELHLAEKCHERALYHAKQALELDRAAGHFAEQASALNAVGWIYALTGEHEKSIRYCEEALCLLQKNGDPYTTALTTDTLGYAHHHLRHHREAINHYRRAIAIFNDLGATFLQADVLTHLGDTHVACGDRAAAHAAWQQALHLLEQLHAPDTQAVRSKLHQLEDH
jgi:DNA-binding SARP family transcriptional activator/tetratricopeptide (TPR) repeat protein